MNICINDPKQSVSRKWNENGFGRTELTATVLGVVVLAVVGALFLKKSRSGGSASACLENLKVLGAGMQVYSQSNGERLPYAFIHHSNTKQSVWDDLVGSYVRSTMRGEDKSVPAPSGAVYGKLLQCPEDKVAPLEFAVKSGLHRRTYAMPWHSMDRKNWPPAGTNTTGAGLWWASYGQGNTSVTNLSTYPKGGIPAIRTSIIADAAQTMLLTEMAKSNNVARNSSGGRIRYTGEHLEEGVVNPLEYHKGMINYLMVDGHVETLQPGQTVGPAGQIGSGWNTHFGIWSINPTD